MIIMVDSHVFHEAHFRGLSFQSNVYGLATVPTADGIDRVLVAPLRGKVHVIEFQKAPEELKPISREVDFLFIPEDSEFISIDSICKSSEEGCIIALTFIKDCESSKPSYSINIYYPWEQDSHFNLDSISKSFCTIELDYVPYFLSHGTKATKEGYEEVFLLSCGDKQIHIFQEDKDSASNRWVKQVDSESFPEFQSMPSVVLWFDMKILPGRQRLTAVGFQNGYLKLCLVSMQENVMLWQEDYEHDSAITCVQLFTSISSDLQSTRDTKEARNPQDYHLLVTSALEVAVVYGNVMKNGFKEQVVLEDSDTYDSTLCACVADIDWDGYNEILIGTYGQELLVYKYKQSAEASPSSKSEVGEHGRSSRFQPDYELLWRRSFAHPLVAVNYMDLTGDGLKELVALSTKGVHILQHNLDMAAKTLLDKISREERRAEDEMT